MGVCWFFISFSSLLGFSLHLLALLNIFTREYSLLGTWNVHWCLKCFLWMLSCFNHGKTMQAVQKIIVEQTIELVCICSINNCFLRQFKMQNIPLCFGYTCSSQITSVDWVAAWVEDISQVVPFSFPPTPINVYIHALVSRQEPLHCCRKPFHGKSQMKNIHGGKKMNRFCS